MIKVKRKLNQIIELTVVMEKEMRENREAKGISVETLAYKYALYYIKVSKINLSKLNVSQLLLNKVAEALQLNPRSFYLEFKPPK